MSSSPTPPAKPTISDSDDVILFEDSLCLPPLLQSDHQEVSSFKISKHCEAISSIPPLPSSQQQDESSFNASALFSERPHYKPTNQCKASFLCNPELQSFRGIRVTRRSSIKSPQKPSFEKYPPAPTILERDERAKPVFSSKRANQHYENILASMQKLRRNARDTNPPPSLLIKNEAVFTFQSREKGEEIYRGSSKRRNKGLMSDRLYKGRTVNCSEERKPHELDDRFSSLRKKSNERPSISRKITFEDLFMTKENRNFKKIYESRSPILQQSPSQKVIETRSPAILGRQRSQGYLNMPRQTEPQRGLGGKRDIKSWKNDTSPEINRLADWMGFSTVSEYQTQGTSNAADQDYIKQELKKLMEVSIELEKSRAVHRYMNQ